MALHALVAFDNAFFEHGEEAQEYWNFHVKTLLPNLDVSRLTRVTPRKFWPRRSLRMCWLNSEGGIQAPR